MRHTGSAQAVPRIDGERANARAKGEIDMSTRRILSLVAILLFAQSTPALAADLSPATWPIAQRTAAENLEAVTPSPPVAHVVEGRAGIVSATLSPIAAPAGAEALTPIIADHGPAPDPRSLSTPVKANLSIVRWSDPGDAPLEPDHRIELRLPEIDIGH